MINNKKINSDRLKSARLYRFKTIEQLSKESNIENIKSLEEGKSTPTLENILSLSKVLNFPREYFFEENSVEVDVKGSYFNIHQSQYRKEELGYIEKMVLTHKIFSYLEKYISFPQINIIHEDVKKNNMEYIASKVRTHYNLGNYPIYNVLSLLEVSGFIVSTINSGKNSVGAFIQKQEIYGKERYLVAIGNDKKSAARRNYDLAVQLGHAVLHNFTNDKDTISKEEFKKIKEEAINFACALLLPKESFIEDLAYPSDLNYYVAMKEKYIVPIDIMILRAYQLGIISYRKYDYLLKEMKKQGWNKKEPLDEIKATKPVICKRGIEIMMENNVISSGGLKNDLSKDGLSLYQEEIEELLGLKKGYLKPKEITTKVKDNIKVINFGDSR